MSEALDALGDEYRRRLLLALREHNPQRDGDTQHVASTSDHDLASSNDDVDPRIMIYHTHLPKLEAAGFIGWDRAAGTIEKGPAWSDIEPLLDVIDDEPFDAAVESA